MNKSELKKIWSQVPVDYYQKSVENNPLQALWHTLKIKTFKNLVKGMKVKKVLDIGCASGYMTNKISQILSGSQIWGIDVYAKAINFGKRKYPRIEFKVADARNLPFRANSFDLVVCYETIEHVLNPLKMLKEIQRVLKKNGYALVAMDSGSLLFRVVWFVWENTKGKVWRKAHLHTFKHKNLEKLIEKSGFTIFKKKFSHLGMEVTFLLKTR
jgi:ubiquinone/menaquinone biosynthesis C-methylase UbiE